MCIGTHDFIPAPNTAKLELIVLEHGQRMENVVHLRKADGWSESEIRLLAEAAVTKWITYFAPLISNDVFLVLTRATDLSAENSFGYEKEPDETTQGEVAVAGLPGNVTVATKFASGLTGRSQRGRAFWIGLTELQVTGNHLVDPMASNISTAWENFFIGIAAEIDGAEHVVVSYCHNGAWRTTAQVTAVTSYVTESNTDSMRGRLTGRGD